MPENPINANESKAAVINTIGAPRTAFGKQDAEALMRSRIPANKTIARVNPIAFAKLKHTA